MRGKMARGTVKYLLHFSSSGRTVFYSSRSSIYVVRKICIILVRQNRKMKLLCASAAASEQQKLSPYQRFRQYRNARTFLVCVAIVVCFAVTALPMQIMFFLSISNIIEFPRFYWWFEVVHNFGVSAVNPFIYGTLDRKLFSSSIRRLRKILHV